MTSNFYFHFRLAGFAAVFGCALFVLCTQSVSAQPVDIDVEDPFTAEEIPSPLWPTYVRITTEAHEADNNLPKNGTRGVLQRCEGDQLVVDFGRHGVMRVPVENTDFYERAAKLMLGETSKQFPNLVQQIGTKLMRFSTDGEPTHVAFDEAKEKKYFLFVYLGEYEDAEIGAFYEFTQEYSRFVAKNDSLIGCVLPVARKWYDLSFTLGADLPFISTHLRAGYIKGLGHDVTNYPALVLTDANGKILYRSPEDLRWGDLAGQLEPIAATLGIGWEPTVAPDVPEAGKTGP